MLFPAMGSMCSENPEVMDNVMFVSDCNRTSSKKRLTGDLLLYYPHFLIRSKLEYGIERACEASEHALIPEASLREASV